VIGSAVAVSGANYGVVGQSYSPSGAGVYAYNGPGGLALKTNGRAKFSTSGMATIVAGSKSMTVTPGVNVTSGSFVLLTPMANLGGRDLWCLTDAANNQFTIHMSPGSPVWDESGLAAAGLRGPGPPAARHPRMATQPRERRFRLGPLVPALCVTWQFLVIVAKQNL
jgi:hypothetical protein